MPLCYVHHLPGATAMGASDKNYALCGGRHEPVESRRNTPSVSLLLSLPHALQVVYHLISQCRNSRPYERTEEQCRGCVQKLWSNPKTLHRLCRRSGLT